MGLRTSKIKAVIQKDAAVRHNYINDKGETCVIGGLYLEAGGDPDLLGDINTNTAAIMATDYNKGGLRPVKETDFIRKLLRKTYGLTNKQMKELQDCNDSEYLRSLRKARLLEIVDSWTK